MQQPQTDATSMSIIDCVRERRKALPESLEGVPKENDPLWGLALSGGGIRSATFALGLVSGLAEKKSFTRFDLLSTVSGGGYAGSALGKLYSDRQADNQTNAGNIEQELGQMSGSWFVWWLRATSRYLIPRGAGDIQFAVTVFLRNVVAVHTEFAVFCIAAGALLALVNVMVWHGLFVMFSGDTQYLRSLGWMFPSWMSTWWLLLPLPAMAAVPLASAYWTIPSGPGERGFSELWLSFFLFALGSLGFIAAWVFPNQWTYLDPEFWRYTCVAAGGFLFLAGIGPFIARIALFRFGENSPVSAALQRNRLTNSLSWALKITVYLFVLGLLDRMAWWVAFDEHQALKQWMPVVIAAVIALVRALASQVPSGDQAAATSSRFGFFAAESAGWLLLALLVIFWVSIAYRLGFDNLFDSVPNTGLEFGAAEVTLIALILLPIVYMVITGRNADFANLSSLHMFYRARLTRSYLGAANVDRFGQPPLSRVDRHADTVAQMPKVFDVAPGDSVKVSDYEPYKKGGPVHILNATINQTQAVMGGLFNQDRKGQYLSVASGGLSRLGLGEWVWQKDVADSELPAWMAISGAAVAPGLGGQTTSGLAVLLFMAGVRLGYWRDTKASKPQSCLRKYALLWNEALADFGGAEDRYQYLSDGGHFENTAAYTLLRERARLIVLSDAAADPDFRYNDLENLVRKARIDLLAQIRFLDQAELGHLNLKQFGTLEQLKDPASDTCMALATVTYAKDGNDNSVNSFGWIIYVKPNMYSGAPVDLRNYGRDNPLFPQEPTTDQFFSESQWESYFTLGRELGLQLDRAKLDCLAGRIPTTDNTRNPTDGAPPNPAISLATKPTLRFGPRATVFATSSLSITALIALGTSTWQILDKYAEKRALRQQAYNNEVAGIIGMYEHVIKDRPEMATELISKMTTIAAAYCRDRVRVVNQTEPRLGVVLNTLAEKCQNNGHGSATPACEIVSSPNTRNCLVGNERLPGTRTYWAVDYTDITWALQRLVPRPDPTWAALLAKIKHLTDIRSIEFERPELTAVATDKTNAGSLTGPDVTTNSAKPPSRMPSETGATASMPAGISEAKPTSICSGKRIYIQVYSPLELPQAQEWTNMLRKVGLRVPPTENVTDTAVRHGRSAPRPVTTSTLIYHTEAEAECADELRKIQPGLDIRQLGRGLTPTPGVLELWIPPSSH